MKKNLLLLLAIAVLVAAVLLTCDIQSVDEFYLLHLEDIEEGAPAVTLSIRCDTALQNADRLDDGVLDYLPADGTILPPTRYALRSGDTVFDVLYRAVRHERIPFEYQETPLYGSVYVEGLGYLYEFSCGPTSGWVYRVNGSFPDRGCSAYTLSDGDVIEWVYTCSLGEDVGFEP